MTLDWSEVQERLDGLGLPSWAKDPSGRYLAVGVAFGGYLNVARDQLRGRHQEEFWPAAAVDQFRADDRAALAGGRGVVVPEYLSPDRVVATVKLPLTGPGGPVGTVGVFATVDSSEWTAVVDRLHLRLVRALADPLGAGGIRGLETGLDPDFRRRSPLGAPGVPRWLTAVRSRLLADFRRRWTVAELAEESGVHPGYFGRAFRRAFGVSLHQYLNRLRVDWACLELRAGDRPAGRIAISAGFTDQSHFTRMFKRLTGTTPAVYRQQGTFDGRA